MIKAIDIEAELASCKFFEGRTRLSETPDTFACMTAYRDGAIFAGGFSGVSQWERHPNGEEIVQILKGSVTLTLLTDDGPEKLDVKAGMLVIVPQNTWHQFNAPNGVTIMTTTPQPTEHITDEYPPMP